MLSRFRAFVLAVVLASSLSPRLVAQSAGDVARERKSYLIWLKTAPNSPLAALAQQKVGEGLRLGPDDADIPLSGMDEHRVAPSGAGVALAGPEGKRTVARGGPHRIGKYALYLTGRGPGTVLTVFANTVGKEPPGYYDYNSSLVFTGPLIRTKSPQTVPVLGSDGIEAEATEVGTFAVPLGGGSTLRVLRIPVAGGDESELEIFFRDGTNGDGTYPAGRFVSLHPLPSGEFRLDLNRARNPFCAYSSVYPCPAPWRGNTIAIPVRAGERYGGGGLDVGAPTEEAR